MSARRCVSQFLPSPHTASQFPFVPHPTTHAHGSPCASPSHCLSSSSTIPSTIPMGVVVAAFLIDVVVAAVIDAAHAVAAAASLSRALPPSTSSHAYAVFAHDSDGSAMRPASRPWGPWPPPPSVPEASKSAALPIPLPRSDSARRASGAIVVPLSTSRPT